jgi:hypothetical protein
VNLGKKSLKMVDFITRKKVIICRPIMMVKNGQKKRSLWLEALEKSESLPADVFWVIFLVNRFYKQPSKSLVKEICKLGVELDLENELEGYYGKLSK